MPFITNSVLLNLYLKRISLGGDSLQRSNENVHKLKRIIKIKKKRFRKKYSNLQIFWVKESRSICQLFISVTVQRYLDGINYDTHGFKSIKEKFILNNYKIKTLYQK